LFIEEENDRDSSEPSAIHHATERKVTLHTLQQKESFEAASCRINIPLNTLQAILDMVLQAR